MKKGINKIFVKTFGTLCLVLAMLTAQSQAAASVATPAAPAEPGFVFDVNTVLALVVIFLFFIIAVLGFTLRSSMDLYKEKKDREKGTTDNTAAKGLVMVVAFVCLGTITAIAQAASADAAPAVKEAVFSDNILLRYLLLFIILLELISILVFVKWIKFFTGIEEMQQARGKESVLSMSFGKWWQKFNKFKPIEEEASLDVGHSYDGIRELDNATPPWFTVAFFATIIFGVGYLWRYHVANAAPNQYEEYEISVAEAKVKQEAYLKTQGAQVDETTAKMLDAEGIAAGKTLYMANCVACHGDKGQGGVGPNMTDQYYLHGGAIGDIFKVIKLGVVEKGMQSWKDVFSPTQIEQLASYIKSLEGTKVAGGKEPQGQLDTSTSSPAAADSTSAAPAGDSAAAK